MQSSAAAEDLEELQDYGIWGHVEVVGTDGRHERFAEILVDRNRWRFAIRMRGRRPDFFDPLGFADFLRGIRRARNYVVFRAPKERGGRPIRVN